VVGSSVAGGVLVPVIYRRVRMGCGGEDDTGGGFFSTRLRYVDHMPTPFFWARVLSIRGVMIPHPQ